MLAFSLRYAGAELRRRWSRALVTALGLAAGVSLIVAITGISAGFKTAGAAVLSPLGKVGTDILVTQTATDASNAAKNAAGGDANAGTDAAANSLIAANRSVVTNLATLGKPGAKFTKDFFLLAELLPMTQSMTMKLATLPHVTTATGALTVLASHQTGVVPTIVAKLTTGGQTISQVHRPTALTPAEAASVRSCILSDGGLKDLTSGLSGGSLSKPSAALPSQIEQCLPGRFREYVQQVNVPLETVKQVMNPPQTDIQATPYTAAGLDAADPVNALVTPAQVVSGRYLKAGSAGEVLADASYAASAKLHLGSVIPINGKTFTVVGLVNASIGGQSANLYFPLASLQKLTDQTGHVNVILVRADSVASIATVTAEIQHALPGAHIITASQVADQVKGSLATARKLTDRFGGALAAIAVGGAFLITILLTLGSVAKRVREIGTLRAVGWSRRRMVGQLVIETLGIGIAGAVMGMVLGVAAAAGLTQLAPDLVAKSPIASSANSLAQIVGSTNSEVRSSMHIHIAAQITPTSLIAGASLALIGSLLAGVIAGWRASSLTPAVALRDIG